MLKHAKISASGIARLDKCPASINSEWDGNNEFSDEGTRFAEWCEKCLGEPSAIDQAPEEFREYLTQFIDLIDSYGFDHVWFEHQLGNDDVGGTPDVNGISEDGKVMVIFDTKFGKGVSVTAEWNPQLMSYAAFMLEDMPDETNDVEKIVLVIWQPRDYRKDEEINQWETDVKTIVNFRKTTIERVINKVKTLEILGEEPSDFAEGDHCQFCRRKSTCPLKTKDANLALVAIGQDESTEPILTDEQVRAIAGNAARIRAYIKDCEGMIFEKLETEQWTPEQCGFHIVEVEGNRQWRKDIAEDQMSKKLARKFTKEATHADKKLLSPAQLKASLKKANLLSDKNIEWVDSLIERPLKKKLMPVPALIAKQDACADFNTEEK